MILLEIGLNNHHIAIAQQQQNKSMVLGGVHSPELEFKKLYQCEKCYQHRIILSGNRSWDGGKSYNNDGQA